MKRPKPIRGLKKFVSSHRTSIKEVVREPTAGGIIYRVLKPGEIEFLMVQDAKNRWTIPKGHVEPEENSKQTAEREIREETGLQEMKVMEWLGKIHFRYRRADSLVLMTTEIYLVKALGKTDELKPEEWMNGCKWLPANDALDKIEYDDIGKLMLLAMQKIRKNAGN